jgi:hypothetical protein
MTKEKLNQKMNDVCECTDEMLENVNGGASKLRPRRFWPLPGAPVVIPDFDKPRDGGATGSW